MSQWRKVTTPRVVILKEVCIHIKLLEQHLRDWLVPTTSEPLTPVVAATQVNANRHVLRSLRDRLVDQLSVLVGQSLEVLATLFSSCLAHLRVAEVRQVGVVQLHKAASCIIQVLNLLLVHPGEVIEESI